MTGKDSFLEDPRIRSVGSHGGIMSQDHVYRSSRKLVSGDLGTGKEMDGGTDQPSLKNQ